MATEFSEYVVVIDPMEATYRLIAARIPFQVTFALAKVSVINFRHVDAEDVKDILREHKVSFLAADPSKGKIPPFDDPRRKFGLDQSDAAGTQEREG